MREVKKKAVNILLRVRKILFGGVNQVDNAADWTDVSPFIDA